MAKKKDSDATAENEAAAQNPETQPAEEQKPANRQPAKGHIICKVGRQPICEAGEHFAPGSKITLTEDRAKALGGLVTRN